LNTGAQVKAIYKALSRIKLPISFRARTCKMVAIFQGSTSFEWPLSVKTGLEKPRWVLVGIQTGRTSQTETPAVFDNLGLTNAYISLNDIKYPSNDVCTDFHKNDYARLYSIFDNFEKDFYEYDEFVGGSQVNFPAFKSIFPILVFDLTNQSEVIKTGAIDMRLTLNYTGTVPGDGAAIHTNVYALIISDRLFSLISDGKTISQMIS